MLALVNMAQQMRHVHLSECFVCARSRTSNDLAVILDNMLLLATCYIGVTFEGHSCLIRESDNVKVEPVLKCSLPQCAIVVVDVSELLFAW